MNVYKYLTCLIMNTCKLKMVKMSMGELGGPCTLYKLIRN